MFEVKAGDIFFTRSQSLLGRAIRWVEHDPNEPNGVWANHTGLFVGDGTVLDAPVVEALWKVRKGPLQFGQGVAVAVFRPTALSHSQQYRLGVVAESFVGATYGWWKLLFHLADRAFFKGKKVLSRFLFKDNRPICSYLAAHAYNAVGISFGMDPDAADPDEMMDYCLAHPDEWEFVGASEVERVA